jgi:hypothetical protein
MHMMEPHLCHSNCSCSHESGIMDQPWRVHGGSARSQPNLDVGSASSMHRSGNRFAALFLVASNCFVTSIFLRVSSGL